MSQAYQYPLSSFPNGINLDKFSLQITQEVTITKILQGITQNGTVITIIFNESLTSGEQTSLEGLMATHDGQPIVYGPTDIQYYLNGLATVTDSHTGITGPFYIMQNLVNRKELFNDTSSPLYDPSLVPILGASGLIDQLNTRASNMDIIHAKTGWHQQQVNKGIYRKPARLLIYYGYLNSFNSTFNQWTNELVAQDISQYDIVVFGDGVANPTHPDYANTQVIISRLKALKPSMLIFGYIAATETLVNFQTKAGQWDTLQIHGVLIDTAGYDFGITRAQQNTMIDYVHQRTYAKLVFVNAWNTNHLLGTENDVSFPNTTFNPSLVQSNLTYNDWILLESFCVNTQSFSANNGYETKAEWSSRGVVANSLRSTYELNFAACGMISNSATNGADLFRFGYISSLMWSLDAYGVSDTNYASSSAAVRPWCLLNVEDIELPWSNNPSIQNDLVDNDIYYRYLNQSKLVLDFSTGAQRSTVENLETKADIKQNVKLYETFVGATVTSPLFGTAVNGTGAAATVSASAFMGKPGVLTLTTGTTTTGRAAIYSNPTGISIGDGILKIEYVIMVPTLADGTNSYTLRVGAGDSNTGDPVDGLFFRYSQANANWITVSRSNNSETATTLSYAVQANVWYRLTVQTNFNGTKARFFINGVPVAQHTANIPTTDVRCTGLVCSIIKTLGTTARTVNIDYGGLEYELTNCR